MTKQIFYLQKLNIILIVFLLLFSANILLNATGDHDKSVNDVLKDIREELKLNESDRINPDKVPDYLLEELGEALMSEMHTDEKTHEYMDNMMGGEGSDSLRRAHINMGYNYLSGNTNSNRGGFWRGMPMRGGMMWNSNSRFGHYGRFDRYDFLPGGIIMGIVFIILIIAAVFAVITLVKKGNIFGGLERSETSLEILKKRYAKGEISKEEYENMKKDIL